MSEAATPAEQKPNGDGGTPPAAPAATPATAQPEMVTLDKKAHDQLVKDAARASESQSRADRYEGILKRNGLLGGGHFKPATPAPATPAPTAEERQAAGAEEDRKAERGLLSIAVDPAYREVFDADPTLRTLFTQSPLSVLPILAPDALDADDAISLVKEALAKRKPAPPSAPPATPPAAPAVPPAGGINPSDKPINEAVETARKNPNTERAVAGMIGARLKENAGKK